MQWKVVWKVFSRDEWNGKKVERKVEWKRNGMICDTVFKMVWKKSGSGMEWKQNGYGKFHIWI